MRTKTPVKMSDIAAKLGVSIVTVSKALNDKEDGVSRTLKEQIKKTANEMGYKKAGAAQGGTHNNIGVIISERFLEDNSFYWQIYQNLQAKLVENGYFGILEICRSDDEKKTIRSPYYFRPKSRCNYYNRTAVKTVFGNVNKGRRGCYFR